MTVDTLNIPQQTVMTEILEKFLKDRETLIMQQALLETESAIVIGGHPDTIQYVFNCIGFCMVSKGTTTLATLNAILKVFSGPDSSALSEERKPEGLPEFIRKSFEARKLKVKAR